MVAIAKEYQTVADLMHDRAVDLDELVRATGMCQRIVNAIAQQRYTPSPQQRRAFPGRCAFREVELFGDIGLWLTITLKYACNFFWASRSGSNVDGGA